MLVEGGRHRTFDAQQSIARIGEARRRVGNPRGAAENDLGMANWKPLGWMPTSLDTKYDEPVGIEILDVQRTEVAMTSARQRVQNVPLIS